MDSTPNPVTGIMHGIILWFFGNVIMYLTANLIAPLMDSLSNGMGLSTELNALFSALGWIAILIIWIICTLIWPALAIIKSTAKSPNGLPTVLLALIIWVFGFLYVITQYQYLPSLATLVTQQIDSNGVASTNTIMAIFFWTSTIITWAGALVVAPIYMIYRGFHGDTVKEKQGKIVIE